MDDLGAGVLPDRELAQVLAHGGLSSTAPLDPDQIQPASVDLRLGAVAYRLRASFLPGAGVTVAARLQEPLVMHRIDLAAGAVLETGCVYLVPLMERAALDARLHGAANPKSSTGRIDVFTRLIVDGAQAFDHVPPGYHGPLYAEICPRTFSILARTGDRLSQLRLRRGPVQELRAAEFSIDLARSGPAGFRAKRHAGVIDLARIGGHDPRDYWEPVWSREGRVVLDPGEFYIFASREPILIPPDQAGEMAPIRPELGEFRAHYAGFFDPGFGMPPHPGRAVLEVRSRDVAFILEHAQAVGRLVFEPLTGRPEKLYGEAGSNYRGQGLKLSKHFSDWREPGEDA